MYYLYKNCCFSFICQISTKFSFDLNTFELFFTQKVHDDVMKVEKLKMNSDKISSKWYVVSGRGLMETWIFDIDSGLTVRG